MALELHVSRTECKYVGYRQSQAGDVCAARQLEAFFTADNPKLHSLLFLSFFGFVFVLHLRTKLRSPSSPETYRVSRSPQLRTSASRRDGRCLPAHGNVPAPSRSPRTERRTLAPFPGAAPRGVPHLRALRGCCGERAAASSCAHRVTIDGRNRPSRPTGSGPGRGAGAAAVAGVVREREPLAELRVTDCCGSGGHFKKTLRRPQRAVPPPQLGCVPPVPAGTPGRGCAHSGGEMRLHRARRYL